MSDKIKISINGFGRIGRSILRAYLKYPEKYQNLDIVAVNDIADLNTLVHLFKYDSTMGKFEGDVKLEGANLVINGKKIRVFQNNIGEVPWAEVNTDFVIEATGRFLTKEDGELHIKSGAKKVIFAAPAKGNVDATVVMGVNHTILTKEDKLISNSSCTTNCLAPMMKVLDEAFGLESAFMVTIHSYTNDQNTLDAPHKDLRRARAAALSMIPTTTGATKAVGKVIPALEGKLEGYSVRVPTPDGSLTDVTATLKKEVTAEEVNKAFKEAASKAPLKGILEYVDEPIVSLDIVGNPYSSIFDSLLTQVIGGKGKNLRIIDWYDNEWGFSNRVLDLSMYLGSL